jgi:hypothetical protein
MWSDRLTHDRNRHIERLTVGRLLRRAPGLRQLRHSCLFAPALILLAAASFAASPASAASSYTQTIDSPNSLNAVSCISGKTCVVSDSRGELLSTKNASASAAATWTAWMGPGFSPSHALDCPTKKLCLLSAGGGALYYAAAVGGAWTEAYTPAYGVDAISCSSAAFCVDGQNGEGYFRYSTEPASTSWELEQEGSASMNAVDCTSTSFCAIADGAGSVHVAKSKTKIESGPWVTSDVDGSRALHGIACTSSSSCLAIDGAGNVLRLALSGEGAATPTTQNIDGSNDLTAITCPTASICTVADSQGGVYVSIDGGASWIKSYAFGGSLTSVSCASETLCVTVDTVGRADVFSPKLGYEEAKESAEREAKEKAEREAREKAEREAREKAEREAREKAEREAKERECRHVANPETENNHCYIQITSAQYQSEAGIADIESSQMNSVPSPGRMQNEQWTHFAGSNAWVEVGDTIGLIGYRPPGSSGGSGEHYVTSPVYFWAYFPDGAPPYTGAEEWDLGSGPGLGSWFEATEVAEGGGGWCAKINNVQMGCDGGFPTYANGMTSGVEIAGVAPGSLNGSNSGTSEMSLMNLQGQVFAPASGVETYTGSHEWCYEWPVGGHENWLDFGTGLPPCAPGQKQSIVGKREPGLKEASPTSAAPNADFEPETGPTMSSSQLRTAALAVSAAVGHDPSPAGIEAASVTVKQAASAMSPTSSVPASTSPQMKQWWNSQADLVVLHGSFTLPGMPRASGATGVPSGSVLDVVLDAHTGAIEATRISGRAPSSIAALGAVRLR